MNVGELKKKLERFQDKDQVEVETMHYEREDLIDVAFQVISENEKGELTNWTLYVFEPKEEK